MGDRQAGDTAQTIEDFASAQDESTSRNVVRGEIEDRPLEKGTRMTNSDSPRDEALHA